MFMDDNYIVYEIYFKKREIKFKKKITVEIILDKRHTPTMEYT